MGFAEIAQADIDFILGGDHAETIEYQQILPEGPQAWKTISHAIIEFGDPSAPLELGGVNRRGPDPIQVCLSKDPTIGISVVHERQDKVKLNPGTSEERIYLVVAILDPSDPAMWRLYASA